MTVTEKRARKLQKHRINMVEFRVKKKEELNSLKSEHSRLERAMKHVVAYAQTQILHEDVWFRDGYHIKWKMLRQLIITTEVLRKQNTKFGIEIQRHEAFRDVVSAGYHSTGSTKKSILPGGEEVDGRWVSFIDGTPSFYFHPLSAENIRTAPNPLDAECMVSLSEPSLTDKFLGWSVSRDLNLSMNTQGSFRARFTKRVQCSVDTAYKLVCDPGQNFRALLATPVDWSFHRYPDTTTQVLQEIGPNCRVMVQNISSPTILRYLFLERTEQNTLPDGRRKLGYSITVTDSIANKMSRNSKATVDWADKGWAYFTFTEVDEASVDVVYEQWASCENPAGASTFQLQWAEFLLQWEQTATPFSLLW
ncbi:unnamed protein product [Phytophthora lilii]|uniref:Unnamed protein product n=1 Tax=Phytophthora lilii TaxID=2077276 RepID=A0A9W6WKC9_9STRA|nr:unnamed protein product [Phytophthora lilii]